MQKRNLLGFAVLEVMIAIALLGLAAVAVFELRTSEIVQRQSLAASTQRSAFSSFQQEVVLQGIDPTKIINPLTSIASPVKIDSSVQPINLGGINIGTVALNSSSGAGGAQVDVITSRGVNTGGERSSGVGVYVQASGPNAAPPPGSTQLNAAAFTVTLPLTVNSFPATGWLSLPSNPPGTVYRYTTDGSEPTATSPIWNLSAALAVNAANFPAQMKIAAFHGDPQYAPSASVSVSDISMTLPFISFQRSGGGSSTIFTYSQMTASQPNGIILQPADDISILPYAIRYTIDGSDPRSSLTAQTYSGRFVVPFNQWVVSGTTATSVVLAVAVVQGDSRYIPPAPNAFSLSSQREPIPTPSFLLSGSSGPVAQGTTVNFNDAIPIAVLRSAKWQDPTASSPAGWSTTVP